MGNWNDFSTYLSNFKRLELASTTIISRDKHRVLFRLDSAQTEVPDKWVKKFISASPEESCSYRYGFALNRRDIKQASQAVIVRKQNYVGTTPYNSDLVELMLVLYSAKGTVLFRKTIAKDNDGWISETSINGATITVRQIKLLDFSKPILPCEVGITEYHIGPNGNSVEEIISVPIRKGTVAWNEEKQDYVLEE